VGVGENKLQSEKKHAQINTL
jgi:hypothetical protein